MSIIGRLIEEVMAENFGGEVAEHPTASTPSTKHFLAALASCGQDSDAVELIERCLAIDARIDGFRDAIAKLMAKYPNDQSFLKQCNDAVSARSEFAALEKCNLLSDWHPGLSQTLMEN